jgi:hypothetical protein
MPPADQPTMASPTIRLVMRLGKTSLTKVTIIGSRTPRPIPVSRRRKRKDSKDRPQTAVARLNTPASASAPSIVGLRPMRSAMVPLTRDPIMKPIRPDDTRRPA